MSWKIALFQSSRQDNPVEEFIKSLNDITGPKVARNIRLLMELGNLLGMPHSKKLTNDLYELRIRGKEEIRIFYAFKNKQIILLHGFKKKSQKTPQKEIETALKRLDII